MKKLIPAIVMLIVSAVVLSTASYAWFTTSQSVTASGMQVQAKAPTSVLISGINSKTTTEGANAATTYNWSEFSSSLNFAAGLGVRGLSPVSSADGVNFLAADKCSDASGAIEIGSTISNVTATGENTYWVDYEIELKNDAAAADGSADQIKLVVEKLEAATGALNNAVRVAFIVSDASANQIHQTGKDDDVAVKDDKSNVFIYVVDGNNSAYTGSEAQWVKLAEVDEDSNNVVYNTKANGPLVPAEEGQTVNFAGQAVTYKKSGNGTEAPAIATLEGQQYVRITVRVWFEGQDAACITSNAGATAVLNITFGIQKPTANP